MAGGKLIAERLRLLVQAHELKTELGPLRCTLSVGIVTFPADSTVKTELFEKADQCLYYCKRMGRNRSATCEEMSFDARLRAAGEA
jgi:GGDEF domain-containing protein